MQIVIILTVPERGKGGNFPLVAQEASSLGKGTIMSRKVETHPKNMASLCPGLSRAV